MTEMNLDSNQSILITGENGAGKTTALEAFYFAMSGKPYRKIKKDELINQINKKELYVEVEFEHENHSYLLKRGIKPNIFELYKDYKLIDLTASTKDYQTILENLIGVDSDTFANTIFISSKNYTPFLKLKAEDKRNFIENVLNIKMFSQILEEAKIKRTLQTEKHNDILFNLKNTNDKLNIAKESNQKYSQNNAEEVENLLKQVEEEKEKYKPIQEEMNRIDVYLKRNTFEEKIEEANQFIKEVEEKIKSNSDDIKHKYKLKTADLKDKIDIINKTRSILTKTIDDYKSERFTAEKEYDRLVRERTTEHEKIQSECDKELSKVYNDFKIFHSKQENIISTSVQAIDFYNHNTECPTCKQKIDEKNDIIAAHLKNLHTIIADANKAIEDEKEKNDVIVKEIQKRYGDKINAFLKDNTEKKEAIKTKIETEINSTIKKGEKSKEQLQKEINEIEAEIQLFQAQMEKELSLMESEKLFSITSSKERKAKYEEDLKKAKDRLSILNNDKFKIDTIINSKQERINELNSIEKKPLIDTSSLEKEIDQYEKDKQDSEYQKETINEMIKILSDKGIKTYIVAKYIPYLNELINKYLEIFNANYRLQFDANFDIKISGRGYEKLGYYSFSSGEEQRVDLALLFSFYELGKMKSSINSNIVLLDEISDKSLDSDGLNGLFDVFKNMKRKGMTIFNISHRPEVKDRFDKVYKVTKSMFSSINEE